MKTTIETKRTDNLLTISIPAGDLSTRQIQRLVDLVKFETIVSKSKLTQKDADEIAREINRSWWKKNGPRIMKMISEHE